MKNLACSLLFVLLHRGAQLSNICSSAPPAGWEEMAEGPSDSEEIYTTLRTARKYESKSNSSELNEPWRHMAWRERDEIFRYLQLFVPTLGILRILLHGPTGAGKSCFINSVQRTFLGRNAIGALEQTSRTGASFTRTIKTHKLKKAGGGRYPFVFCDIMGLEAEEAGGIQPEDIVSVLQGHVSDGYTFNPLAPITSDSKKYIEHPQPCDKVHCLVSILPADSISRMSDEVISKMKTIRQKASQLGIPQVIVMTKVDQACEIVHKDLKKIYHSRKIKEKMEECSNKLGISMNSIYPVKNYHAEITQDATVDLLLLMALRDIVNFANDYVEDLYEQSSC